MTRRLRPAVLALPRPRLRPAVLVLPRPRLRRPARRTWVDLATCLGFLALSCLEYRAVVADLGHLLPAGHDSILYAWYLEWTRTSVAHLGNPLYSTAMAAPGGFNVMWNTWMPAVGLVCAPFVALAGPFVVTSVLFVLAPAAAATSAYLVTRRLIDGWAGAVLVALLFALGPFRTGHDDHLTLLLTPLLPPMALLLHRVVTSAAVRRVRTGVVLGLLVTLQLMVSEEMLVLFALAALAAVLAHAAVAPARVRQWAPRLGVVLGVAALAVLVLFGVPLGYQLFGPGALRHGVSASQSADLASFVRPGRGEWLHTASDLRVAGGYGASVAESTGYLGLPLVLLCAVAVTVLLVRRDRVAAWWLLTVCAVGLLSLGVSVRWEGSAILPGPWRLVQGVPVVASAQPVRLTLFVSTLAGILIAYVAARLGPRGRVAVLGAAALCLVPLLPPPGAHASRDPVTPAVLAGQGPRRLPAGTRLLFFPFPTLADVTAMGWQVGAGLRFSLAGGYSVFDDGSGHSAYRLPPPPCLTPLEEAARRSAPSAVVVAAAQDCWRAGGYDYLVVAPSRSVGPAVVRAAEEVTGVAPQAVGHLTFFGPPLAAGPASGRR